MSACIKRTMCYLLWSQFTGVGQLLPEYCDTSESHVCVFKSRWPISDVNTYFWHVPTILLRSGALPRISALSAHTASRGSRIHANLAYLFKAGKRKGKILMIDTLSSMLFTAHQLLPNFCFCPNLDEAEAQRKSANLTNLEKCFCLSSPTLARFDDLTDHQPKAHKTEGQVPTAAVFTSDNSHILLGGPRRMADIFIIWYCQHCILPYLNSHGLGPSQLKGSWSLRTSNKTFK